MKKSLCSGLNPVKLCSHEVAAKGTSTLLWTSCGACENHTCLFVFAFVLSWRDSRTRPPARQDIFFKPSDGDRRVNHSLLWRGHVGRDGRRRGGGGTGDERQLSTWHKPARSAADSSGSRMQGRWWRREGEEWEDDEDVSYMSWWSS